jgi:hypothetical protein
MTYSTYFSLPLWGRAGVGARGLRYGAALRVPSAPIPTFPQGGKEQEQEETRS